MKAFTNQNARTLDEAVALAQEALRDGRSVSFIAGGTDLLQLMKDKVVESAGVRRAGRPRKSQDRGRAGWSDLEGAGRRDRRRADHSRRAHRTSRHP